MASKSVTDREENVLLNMENPSQVQQPLRSEMDSPDDFEHLGGSSPIKEVPSLHAEASAREQEGKIDSANTAPKIADVSFDPVQKEFHNIMDTNLLEMGDSFPDRKVPMKEDEHLSEISSIKATQELLLRDLFSDSKAASQTFVDLEREHEQKLPATAVDEVKSTITHILDKPLLNYDTLEHYSDSESEPEPFRQVDNSQKKEENLPVTPQNSKESFESVPKNDVIAEPVQVFEEAKPAESKVQDVRNLPSEPKVGHEVKEQTSQAVKESSSAESQTVKPAPPPKFEVEIMFCKIGLGITF